MEWRLLFLACISFSLSLGMALVKRAGGTRRDDLRAVQSMHVRHTSRFGGLAVLIAYTGGLLITSTSTNPIVLNTLTCMIPIFLVGISEDAGWRVAPRWRLLAAACSSLLTIFAYGSVIDRLGVFQLDFVFEQQAIAVALTVLALTGVSQSFNLLDGLHGLCGFTAAIIAAALTLISIQAGQVALGQASALLVPALAGFLALNFPRGLVFLGDAGATCIGFILACTSVHILYVQPDVAPWALVLVFFWPIADTLLSIARRLKRSRSATQPDRMHFHHIVMRAFEILVLRKKNRSVSNPAATMILLPLIAAPSVAGVLFWNRDDFALTAVALFAALFLATYGAIVRSARQRRRLFTVAGSKASRTLDLRKKVE